MSFLIESVFLTYINRFSYFMTYYHNWTMLHPLYLFVYSWPLNNMGFELHGSICTWIFFNKYSTCIFILGIFKSTKCGKNLCLIRDHNMWYQKNQGLSPDSIQTI